MYKRQGAGLVHQWVLAVVVGKGVVLEIAVLQALCLSAFDTLHAALPFFSSLAPVSYTHLFQNDAHHTAVRLDVGRMVKKIEGACTIKL